MCMYTVGYAHLGERERHGGRFRAYLEHIAHGNLHDETF